MSAAHQVVKELITRHQPIPQSGMFAINAYLHHCMTRDRYADARWTFDKLVECGSAPGPDTFKPFLLGCPDEDLEEWQDRMNDLGTGCTSRVSNEVLRRSLDQELLSIDLEDQADRKRGRTSGDAIFDRFIQKGYTFDDFTFILFLRFRAKIWDFQGAWSALVQLEELGHVDRPDAYGLVAQAIRPLDPSFGGPKGFKLLEEFVDKVTNGKLHNHNRVVSRVLVPVIEGRRFDLMFRVLSRYMENGKELGCIRVALHQVDRLPYTWEKIRVMTELSTMILEWMWKRDKTNVALYEHITCTLAKNDMVVPAVEALSWMLRTTNPSRKTLMTLIYMAARNRKWLRLLRELPPLDYEAALAVSIVCKRPPSLLAST